MSNCIHTERLVLRPFRSGDAIPVAELVGNLAVSRWLTRVPHPYVAQDAVRYFKSVADAKNVLIITLSDEVIGGCSIEDELGYWLGAPFWGKGYASEAARALIDRYFSRQDTPLQSGFMVGNIASGRVLTKLGFTPRAVEDVHCLALDSVVSVQKMTLSASAWKPGT